MRKEWTRTTNNSGYSFTKSNKPGTLADKFTKHIVASGGCTLKGFYDSMGKKYSKANCSGFFSKIREAGIVTLIDKKYYLGENYTAWVRGELTLTKPKPKLVHSPFTRLFN